MVTTGAVSLERRSTFGFSVSDDVKRTDLYVPTKSDRPVRLYVGASVSPSTSSRGDLVSTVVR